MYSMRGKNVEIDKNEIVWFEKNTKKLKRECALIRITSTKERKTQLRNQKLIFNSYRKFHRRSRRRTENISNCHLWTKGIFLGENSIREKDQ